jgi:hypothetical protein
MCGGAATTTTGLGGGKFERKIRNGSRNVIFRLLRLPPQLSARTTAEETKGVNLVFPPFFPLLSDVLQSQIQKTLYLQCHDISQECALALLAHTHTHTHTRHCIRYMCIEGSSV